MPGVKANLKFLTTSRWGGGKESIIPWKPLKGLKQLAESSLSP
jgi:hypothetical protein